MACKAGILGVLLLLGGCGPRFAPHPGHVLFRTLGQPDRVEDAASVPDGVKFVYYGPDGAETDGRQGAVRRVPVVEIDMARDPKTGWVEIVQYGPGRRFLKSTVGSAGPG